MPDPFTCAWCCEPEDDHPHSGPSGRTCPVTGDELCISCAAVAHSPLSDDVLRRNRR